MHRNLGITSKIDHNIMFLHAVLQRKETFQPYFTPREGGSSDIKSNKKVVVSESYYRLRKIEWFCTVILSCRKFIAIAWQVQHL
jgi:hypothetical protein